MDVFFILKFAILSFSVSDMSVCLPGSDMNVTEYIWLHEGAVRTWSVTPIGVPYVKREYATV